MWNQFNHPSCGITFNVCHTCPADNLTPDPLYMQFNNMKSTKVKQECMPHHYPPRSGSSWTLQCRLLPPGSLERIPKPSNSSREQTDLARFQQQRGEKISPDHAEPLAKPESTKLYLTLWITSNVCIFNTSLSPLSHKLDLFITL